MSQSGGFDVKSMSTAHKILLGAGILYIINVFLQWNRVCIDLGVDIGVDPCGGVAGTHGIGIINLLLAIALVAWEAMGLAGVNVQAPKALVSAGLAGAIVLFTILKILIDNEFLYIFAWIGLILAAVIGYGGYMRWQEHQAGGGASSPPPAMPGAP
jgi:hypothetical protein